MSPKCGAYGGGYGRQ